MTTQEKRLSLQPCRSDYEWKPPKRVEGETRHSLLIATAALCIGLLVGCTGVEVSRYYNTGVLATASPIATSVGEEVFQQGGNAFDAAVAVGFVLAVVHPEAGNLGGGGFALIRDGKTKDIRALDFRETAPRQAFETMYLDERGEVVPNSSTFGVQACGVPGTVAGLYELWKTYGSLPWEQLVGKASVLADTGFIIDEYLASSLERHKERLSSFDETAKIFFPEDKSLKAGDRLVQKDLMATLYAVAAMGRDGFYNGPVAWKIVECMEKHGGSISESDLVSYASVWREPVLFSFDSLEIYSMPPPSSGGIAVGQILKLLEEYDFSIFAPDSPEYIHLFCEAARLAFADRSAYLGDPDFYNVPAGLLDSAYLAHRRNLIEEKHATSSELIHPGVPPNKESQQTTHFSICDGKGNMVAVTYTLNTAYGCKLVVDGAGFLLNNEMDDFSIKPGYPNVYGLIGGEANKIEPGKRMLSSMSPTLVLKDNQPFLILGAPGGSRIITVVAQAIINFTRFNLNLKTMVEQPRFHHQWLPDLIYLEQGGFDINITQELIRYGHTIEESEPFSDLQAVFINESGSMTAAADPRKRGVAGGY
jgi:gamma-glutamyltranspeptidase/glutathione hydrolase